jgi:hypothetical protein
VLAEVVPADIVLAEVVPADMVLADMVLAEAVPPAPPEPPAPPLPVVPVPFDEQAGKINVASPVTTSAAKRDLISAGYHPPRQRS